MPLDLEDSIITELVGAGLGLVKDDSIHRGPVVDTDHVPDACVFVMASGGPEPGRFFSDSVLVRKRRVQVQVRSGRGEYNTGRVLAEAIARQFEQGETASYISWMVMGPPVYMGHDDKHRHRWSTNLFVRYSE